MLGTAAMVARTLRFVPLSRLSGPSASNPILAAMHRSGSVRVSGGGPPCMPSTACINTVWSGASDSAWGHTWYVVCSSDAAPCSGWVNARTATSPWLASTCSPGDQTVHSHGVTQW